ncbi:MAG: ABC transporter substrate-binding protein [Tepidisphaeraceae bacterium]
MSKKAWLGVAVAVAIAALAVFALRTRLSKQGGITIGATLPLSGDAAVFGKNTQEGIDLAVKEINDAGGVLGRKITIQYEDTQALAKEGVTAYQKLVSVNKVPAIIDDSVSSVTLAMAPLADRDHVVILATGATAPQISGVSKYVFRIWNSDAYEGQVIAECAFAEMSLKNVAILYCNNEYGQGLKGVFRAQFLGRGGRIATEEAFEQGATDFRTQLTKIGATNPDGIYLVGYPKEIGAALRQSKELGISAKLLGTVALHDQQLIDIAGHAADGVVFPFPKDPTGNQVDNFKTAFAAKYSKAPPVLADVGYDAVRMIARAIEVSKDAAGDQLRQGLSTLKDYSGASGMMTFDERGDVHKPMGIKVIQDGKFVWRS